MKWIWVAIAFLGLAPLCAGTTFTQSISGDWNNPATWGLSGTPTCHTNIPCMTDAGNAGDTIAHKDTLSLYCGSTGYANEICSFGTSGANSTGCTTQDFNTTHVSSGGATIHFYGGSVVIRAGNMCLGVETLQIDPNAVIQHDSSWASSGANYWICPGMAGGLATTLNIVGTANYPTTGGILFEGDSYADTFTCNGVACKSPSHCTTAQVSTCTSGIFGSNGSSNFSNVGVGTVQYTTFQNFSGTGSPLIAVYFSVNTQADAFWQHNQFYYVGTIQPTNNASSTKSIVWTNNLVLNSIFSSTNQGAVSFLRSSPTSGDQPCGRNPVVANVSLCDMDNVVDGMVQNSGKYANSVHQNLYLYRTLGGGSANTAGLYAAYFNVDAGQYIDIFDYATGVVTGASPTNLGNSFWAANTSYSIFWSDRILHNPGGADRGLYDIQSQDVTTASNYLHDNVLGSEGADGVYSSAEAYNLAGSGGGSVTAPAVNAILTIYNNLILLGVENQTTIGFPGGYSHTGSLSGPLSSPSFQIASIQNNVIAANYTGFVNQPTPGSFGTETSPSPDNYIANVSNNIWHNPANQTICIVCGPNPAGYTNTITFADYNGFVGSNTATYVTSFGINYAANWVGSGQGTHDVTILSRALNQAAPRRNPQVFDVQYLIPAGLIPGGTDPSPTGLGNYATADPQYKGIWSSSTAYNLGDVVAYQNASANGNSWTYWRARQAVPASTAKTQPVVGYDASNEFYGHEAYWEMAYMNWYRSQVLNSALFTDGAVGRNTQGAVAVDITRLLNQWMMRGGVPMEPSMQGTGPVSSLNPWGVVGFTMSPTELIPVALVGLSQ